MPWLFLHDVADNIEEHFGYDRSRVNFAFEGFSDTTQVPSYNKHDDLITFRYYHDKAWTSGHEFTHALPPREAGRHLERRNRQLRMPGPQDPPAVELQVHEADDPGSVDPERARTLHAGRELRQARHDGRGGPRVRCPERPGRNSGASSRAANTRSGSRPRSWWTTSEQVVAEHRIGGEARAVVVTNGIERATQYCHAIRDYLKERAEPPRCPRRILRRARLRANQRD